MQEASSLREGWKGEKRGMKGLWLFVASRIFHGLLQCNALGAVPNAASPSQRKARLWTPALHLSKVVERL